MSGWGIVTQGFTETLAAFEALEIQAQDDTIYVVGSSVEYAIYQELGTSKMSAQPYLRPAAEAVSARFDTIAEQADGPGDIVRRMALAIEAEAKQRAPVDTGTLRNSIKAERIQ